MQMKEIIQKINTFAYDYNQIGKKSKLIPAIIIVETCDQNQAEKYAHKHCNLLSTYNLLASPNYIEMGYSDFYRWMMDEDYCDEFGYISAEKPDIFKALGHDIKLVKYTTLDNLPDGFYQIKISNESGGDHFMAGYVLEGILYIADTSFRGIYTPATTALKDDTLIWVKQYVHA